MCTCKYHVITTGGKKDKKKGAPFLSAATGLLYTNRTLLISLSPQSGSLFFLSSFFFSNVLLKFVICTRIVDTWCVIVLFLLSHADGRQCTQSSICISKFVFAIFLQIFIIS